MTKDLYFEYGSTELDWLAKRDPLLGEFISKTGIIKRRVYPDPFYGLIHAIIGQQLSNKAKAAIWRRFLELYPEADAAILSRRSLEDLQSCGLSSAKARCILHISRMFESGLLDGQELCRMDDQSLVDKLSAIKGVGPWTVEMLLLFTFQRKNIMSYGDLALKKGMARLYGHEHISLEIFKEHFNNYAPFASIASFYLWEAARL